MNAILNKLKINETFTKPQKKIKTFNKVKDNIPLEKGLNFMSDVLMLPTTKEGYKYLLVMVDLATDEFDIEPMKDKEAETVLKASKKMFKRDHIDQPEATIRTDGGNEFKGAFGKWMYNENILHNISMPGRHNQMSNVESLNYQLGRLLNGYMNMKEEELGRAYREWTDVIDIVRTDLNKYRKKPEYDRFTHVYTPPEIVKPKYKIGDYVYRRLDVPKSALYQDQNTPNFRAGDYRWDKVPKKIVNIFYYPGKVPIRYALEEYPYVSFQEVELMPSNATESKYVVKALIDKKREKNVTYYKVWWNGYKKSEATWESKAQLIDDGLLRLIQLYDDTHRS